MASMTLVVEIDEMRDAINNMIAVHSKLAHKHGDEYRALERRIDDLIDGIQESSVDIQFIGGGVVVAFPSGEMTEILRECRRLSLLS